MDELERLRPWVRELRALQAACARAPVSTSYGWPVGADVGWAFSCELGLGHTCQAAAYMRKLRHEGLVESRRSRRVCGWIEWTVTGMGALLLALAGER